MRRGTALGACFVCLFVFFCGMLLFRFSFVSLLQANPIQFILICTTTTT